MVNRVVVVGGVGLGAVVLGRRLAAVRRSGKLGVEKRLERMPDASPRKWLFLNIVAIRENTERILERLEERDDVPAEAGRERLATP